MVSEFWKPLSDGFKSMFICNSSPTYPYVECVTFIIKSIWKFSESSPFFRENDCKKFAQAMNWSKHPEDYLDAFEIVKKSPSTTNPSLHEQLICDLDSLPRNVTVQVLKILRILNEKMVQISVSLLQSHTIVDLQILESKKARF